MIGIFLIAVGLAMDAFAVSICKGLSMKKISLKKLLIIALYFGVFQAIMPVIGYFLGESFETFVTSIDHWIALVLLSFIGINMIREAVGKSEEDNKNDDTSFKTMLILAVATSIDALAVGITFAFLETNIIIIASIIGVVTFAISAIGVIVGNKFGDKYEKRAEIFGGVILILMGIKILLEHLLG